MSNTYTFWDYLIRATIILDELKDKKLENKKIINRIYNDLFINNMEKKLCG